MENGWGKERKINGKLAMLTLVASGERGGLKQNLRQMDRPLNYTVGAKSIGAYSRK
jgi:hypothetical protein